jgi:membrane-associated phospholipid phosphatase
VPNSFDGRSARREVLIVLMVFASCPLVAAIAPGDERSAIANASLVRTWDRGLGVDALRIAASSADMWWSRPAWLLYHGTHVPALIGLGVVLWHRRPHLYGQARTSWVIAHLVTVGGYLAWPTAPPRALLGHGIAESWTGVVQYHYAAMPSGHVVFAVLVGVWAAHARLAPPALCALYPVTIGVIVVVTGNHWLADVLVGAIIAMFAVLAVDRRSVPRRTISTIPSTTGRTT